MSSKNKNILDQHLDKIVFGLAGLVALYILYAFVITSPTRIEYDGENYGPASLDSAIRDKAKRVESKLNAPPEPAPAYVSQLDTFMAAIKEPLSSLNIAAWFPLPSAPAGGLCRYSLPMMVDVCDVKVKSISTVAYVPTETVDFQNPYSQANTEPADLDFVTVEARIDTVEIAKRCAEVFNNDKMDPDCKRPDWAKPVFAAVELQRRKMLEDGSWGQWETVQRTQAETLREYFNVPEKSKDLKRGLEVLMPVFDRFEVKSELLQPSTYDFAYPRDSWMPPTLQAKREALPKPKPERPVATTTTRTARPTRTTTRPAAGAGAMGGAGGGMPGMGGGMGMPGGGGGMPGMGGVAGGGARTQRTAPVRTNTRTRPTDAVPDAGGVSRVRSNIKTDKTDIGKELSNMRLTDKTDYSKLKEPLTFWAHDDSTEPGNTYQYRIRTGIFNPTAGSDMTAKEFDTYKDDVILWSNYSKESSSVTIDQRWYFFPLDYRDADKAVTAKVARCILAKWYTKEFRVRPGESIGKVVENVAKEEDAENEPNFIDYSNGVVVVDVLGPVEKEYAEVLYALDSQKIKRLGVKPNWPAALKLKFAEIEQSISEPREELLPRGAEGRTTPRSPGGMEPGMMPGMGMPGMGGPGMMPGMGMPGMPPP